MGSGDNLRLVAQSARATAVARSGRGRVCGQRGRSPSASSLRLTRRSGRCGIPASAPCATPLSPHTRPRPDRPPLSIGGTGVARCDSLRDASQSAYPPPSRPAATLDGRNWRRSLRFPARRLSARMPAPVPTGRHSRWARLAMLVPIPARAALCPCPHARCRPDRPPCSMGETGADPADSRAQRRLRGAAPPPGAVHLTGLRTSVGGAGDGGALEGWWGESGVSPRLGGPGPYVNIDRTNGSSLAGVKLEC